jgi:type II secretory pathway pseudopilin PulG
LVELLIAMVVMNVGLLAIVAAFSSGAIAVARSGRVATASSLADQQMEQYRSLTYDAIGVDTGATLDTTYVADVACQGNSAPCGNIPPGGSNSCASGGNILANFPNACAPIRNVNAASTPASPDRHNYRVDTYVRTIASTTTQRATKLVTVVVRDNSSLAGRALAREASTFDCSTGQIPGAAPC